MDAIHKIYELLEESPQKADAKALELLAKAKSPAEEDSVNWARGYVLVEMKKFEAAMKIWKDIYDRTQSHKALHQIGFVHRSAGNIDRALEIFNEERSLIDTTDVLALSVNSYELAFCHLHLGNIPEAQYELNIYASLEVDNSDPVERGCFFRLKGDIARVQDKSAAKVAYEESLKWFKKAEDPISIQEIQKRISEC